MLNIIAGGAGCGKTYEMMRRIEEAVKAGKNVLVIIPEQFSFEFDRALYERIGMSLFNRVEVLPFTRTAKEIFIRFGGLKGRYADDTVKNIMMFRTLKALSEREGLCFYDKQAKSPRFVESGLEIVKELTLNGVTPEQLTECTDGLDENVRDKVADIALVYSEYTKLLSESGYKDSASDVSEAAKRAQVNDYFRGKAVFVDCFKSFTADEYAMLDAIIPQSESTTICLCTADSTARDFSVFETVNRTRNKLLHIAQEHGVKVSTVMLDEPKRFKDNALSFMSGNILRNIRSKYNGVCNSVKVYNSSDSYGEGDFVGSEIRRLVMEEGYEYKDIAVLARQKENYSAVMESAFERYNIPFYTDESRNAAHKALFIFVKTALLLAADKKASTEEWLRYIKTGMTGLSEDGIAALESYCYKWSVEGDMWGEPFDNNEKTDCVEKYRQRVTEPVFRLRKRCDDADGAEICTAVMDFIYEVGVNKVLCDMYDSCSSEDAAVLSAVRETKQLWEQLCTLLETMSRVLAGEKIGLKDFAELFSNAVSKLKISSPPQTLDCVQFMAAHTARLADPKIIFVLEVNEGVFPFAAKQSGLLSERDRFALVASGIELSGGMRDKLSEERFVAYSVLSGASERVYLSYASADISGKTLYPSLIIGQLCEMFGRDITCDFESRGILSFCTTADAAYYQYVQNYSRNDEDSASLLAALDEIPEYSSRIRYLRSIEAASGHRLTSAMGRKLFGTTVSLSASRFEDYQKCPFMYYCKKGLRLYPPEKIELDKPSRGTAIHYCLSEILASNSKEDFIQLDRARLNKQVKFHLSQYYGTSAVGGDYGKTNRYKAAYSRLSDTLTDILVRLTDEFKQCKFTAREFEYKIGRNGKEKALTLTTPNGITLQFEGSVDRVDVFEFEGQMYVRVIDYKSGTKDFNFEELVYGMNMQMLLYLFAITDTNSSGAYKNAVPSGVLYMPAKDTLTLLGRSDDIEDESQRMKVFNSTYKMKGMVLCESGQADDLVVRAMEEKAENNYIPIRFKRDGGYYDYSKPVTLDELDKLRKYSYELMKASVDEMTDGRIEANPLQMGQKLPCAYCDYKSVCDNYPPKQKRSYNKKYAEKEIDKIMGRGDK
ncbi:MAG: PD-(D/E)XK nuclease family protein [Oscillospiraceae bacterium]|nr:PD-(D/E)XK nuclease family protein [Oscillospiraceae bacterium]